MDQEVKGATTIAMEESQLDSESIMMSFYDIFIMVFDEKCVWTIKYVEIKGI